MLNIKKLKLLQAFSLVELLAVMVIITIIAGLVIGTGRSARDKARRTKAESMMAGLEIALGMYYADVGTYPPENAAAPFETENLYDYLTNTAAYGASGTSPITGWSGPYIRFKTEDLMGTSPEKIKDPWGRSYHYTYNSFQNNPYPSYYDLWCNGAIESPNWWDVYKDLKNW